MIRQKYGIDTSAILRYLTGTLPPRVDKILSPAEDNKIDLVIPSIVVGELIYTIEKGELVSGKQIHKDKLDLIITTLLSFNIFSIRDLTPSGLRYLSTLTSQNCMIDSLWLLVYRRMLKPLLLQIKQL